MKRVAMHPVQKKYKNILGSKTYKMCLGKERLKQRKSYEQGTKYNNNIITNLNCHNDNHYSFIYDVNILTKMYT